MRGGMAVLIVMVGAAGGQSHDLWLVPPVGATAGAAVTVRAVSGSAFPVGDHAPDPAKFARRLAVGPDGKPVPLDAAGTEADAGLLRLTPTEAGVYAVGVETSPKLLTLDAAAFNAYLVKDGLPHVYLLRHREKSLDQPSTERYSKSPKALLRVGTGGGGDPTRPLGLPLEIVPLADPFARKTGDALPVRVLFRGKPLAGVNLGWDHPGGDGMAAGTVRTDPKGEALVPVAKAGLMTVRLTHLTRPKADGAEWESFWTTLTFRVPD